MPRIVVTIAGGCLQSVYTDDPATEVEVIDWDNFEDDEENDGKDPDEHLEQAIVGLTEVY